MSVVRIREHHRRDKCLAAEAAGRSVRQVRDRVVGRPCRYRETVRSEMAIPSFSNSPWIRGAPQRDNSQRPYAESEVDGKYAPQFPRPEWGRSH
jgi:hypothetical protein